jgi:hypothetical protein
MHNDAQTCPNNKVTKETQCHQNKLISWHFEEAQIKTWRRIKHQTMKGYGERSTAPRILNLGAWRTLAVTFASWPHYSWCPKLYSKLGGPKKVWTIWEGKNYAAAAGNLPSFDLMHGTDDWGVCRWPWQFTVERRSPLVIINWCIPVKNTIGWSRVAFCAYELIQLFAAVFEAVKDGE